MCSGFPCEVYTCRLGTNTTNASTLVLHKDDAGNEFARLRCFKLLDDFAETGCREWDRLELNRRRTEKIRVRAPLAVAGRADRRHPGLDQRNRAQAIQAGVCRTTPGPRVLEKVNACLYERRARTASVKRRKRRTRFEDARSFSSRARFARRSVESRRQYYESARDTVTTAA